MPTPGMKTAEGAVEAVAASPDVAISPGGRFRATRSYAFVAVDVVVRIVQEVLMPGNRSQCGGASLGVCGENRAALPS